MKLLQRIVRDLDKNGFQELLNFISTSVDSKARNFVELIKNESVKEKEYPIRLEMTAGAFYTLKSRITPRIIGFYSSLNENKIRQLREEAARVPFIVLNNERLISLGILKDLEKKLKEHDLSSELAVVYKQLARLNRFDESHTYYEREYQRHIAFSLAVSKAEDLLYEYIFVLGYFHITEAPSYREKLDDLLDELENTFELYESHRLYSIYNIVRHYHRCAFLSVGELQDLELEIESILFSIRDILERYPFDPFYAVVRNLIPFLFFEYYVRVGNRAKSRYYLEEISSLIEYQFKAHLWTFFISRFLTSLMIKYRKDGDKPAFIQFREKLRQGYFVEESELSHLVIYFRYRALCEFADGNYARAAAVINNLRNMVRFRDFPRLELEIKLFQAFFYVLSDETDLYLKLVASAKRQVRDHPDLSMAVKYFAKVLFILHKSKTSYIDFTHLLSYWNRFKLLSRNHAALLEFLDLDEAALSRLAGQ